MPLRTLGFLLSPLLMQLTIRISSFSLPHASHRTPRRNSLTSILITRFLLNLRQVARVADLSPSGATSSPVISTQFPSVRLSTGLLGNLGAPLRSGYDSTDDHTEADGELEDKLVYVDEPLLAGLVQVDEVRPDEVELQRFI